MIQYLHQKQNKLKILFAKISAVVSISEISKVLKFLEFPPDGARLSCTLLHLEGQFHRIMSSQKQTFPFNEQQVRFAHTAAQGAL